MFRDQQSTLRRVHHGCRIRLFIKASKVTKRMVSIHRVLTLVMLRFKVFFSEKTSQLCYFSDVWKCLFSRPFNIKHDQRIESLWFFMQQTSSVTDMMQSLHWRRVDQQWIDNKLTLMYKLTHNVIATPISDFLIPLVRPSWHYHLLSYRLITATTDYYNFSFFPRAVFHRNNLSLENVACSTLKQFNQAVCKIDHVSP